MKGILRGISWCLSLESGPIGGVLAGILVGSIILGAIILVRFINEANQVIGGN